MAPAAVEPPACAWPREYHELSLPIGPRHMGSIYLPGHMTESEWDNVMQYLTVVRSVSLREQSA